jgi:N utilization substance protein B
MKDRHEARQAALKTLYCADVTKEARGAELLLEPGVSKETSEYASAIVAGVSQNLEKIDALIEDSSENWTLERMAVVDRNILRIAVYELLYREDVPCKVVLNEAVELAKKFSGRDSCAFINGILDRIAKELRLKEEVPAH